MNSYDDLIGQTLALVLTWGNKRGEDERAVFFGRIERSKAGLSFSRPGVNLDLPMEWPSRIRAAPAELADALEGAPYVLQLMISELPVDFRPQELISKGF